MKDDMSLSGFISVAEALTELSQNVADDDRVFIHWKHCEFDSLGVCTCDPVKLTGKELKGVINDG